MKKQQPYIDHKAAKMFVRMYDFINHANHMRAKMYQELESAIAALQVYQDRLAPVEDPDNQYAHFKYDHFTHDIARLRADAWEAGLTSTLFEKLKDKKFRDRFTGWLGDPVLKEEIEDHYPGFEAKPAKKETAKAHTP